MPSYQFFVHSKASPAFCVHMNPNTNKQRESSCKHRNVNYQLKWAVLNLRLVKKNLLMTFIASEIYFISVLFLCSPPFSPLLPVQYVCRTKWRTRREREREEYPPPPSITWRNGCFEPHCRVLCPLQVVDFITGRNPLLRYRTDCQCVNFDATRKWVVLRKLHFPDEILHGVV
jgi:hypothetical protein